MPQKNFFQKINYVELLVWTFIVVSSLWLSWYTAFYSMGETHIRTRLYSDFGAHIPLIRSFSLSENWPPEYPHFSGKPIAYHFLFYALIGWLERLGVPWIWTLNILTSAGLMLLQGMIYVWTKKLTKASLAGAIAVVLFWCNASLSWFYYVKNFALQGISPFALDTFVQFGPWNGDAISAFWHMNIYTNQRHLAWGFGLVLLMTYWFREIWKNKKSAFKDWKLYALLLLSIIAPITHKATVPLFGIISGIFVVFDNFPSVKLKNLLKKKTVTNVHRAYCNKKIITQVWLLLVLFALSLPLTMYISQGIDFQTYWQPGYLKHANGIWDWIHYWIVNMSLYFILLLPLCFFGNRTSKSLSLASLTFFAIANLFVLSPDIINNHKLINMSIILLTIVIASLLYTLVISNKIVPTLVGATFFTLLLFSGLVDFVPIVTDRTIVLIDVETDETSQWILNNTAKDATFLVGDNRFYNPASQVGRKLFFGYSYFPWSMGYDTPERDILLNKWFSATISQETLCKGLLENNIDYISHGSGIGELAVDVQQSYITKNFVPIYKSTNGMFIVYDVANNCNFNNI